jgi:hypothetical protein
MAHRCPPRCHRCPDLDRREVLPYCMGTAAMGIADATSLAWCTCKRPGRGGTASQPSPEQQRIDSLERQVLALKSRIDELAT